MPADGVITRIQVSELEDVEPGEYLDINPQKVEVWIADHTLGSYPGAMLPTVANLADFSDDYVTGITDAERLALLP